MNDQIPSRQHSHIILDSDGSPDSVVAMLYFLQNPAVSLDALTVSCGEAYPDTYTAILRRILVRVGRKALPVAAGRATPLVGNNAFPEPWRQLVNDFMGIALPEADGPAHPLPAAELIIRMLEESPTSMTLFVSGSHTNLAEALRLNPGIKSKIASVHVMGGALYVPGNIESEWPAIHNPVAEWNIWVDPVAASEVFNAGLPLYLVPLDTTDQVIWTAEDAEALEASGTLEGKLAAEILRISLDYMHDSYPEGVHLWDLVTAVTGTHPHLCQQKQLHVQVVTEPGPQQGRTAVLAGRPANVTAHMRPDADAIKQRAIQILGLPRDHPPGP